MKKLIALVLLGLVFTVASQKTTVAQTVTDGIYEKENVPGKRPVPFRALREADVLWSKKIWQVIDARKKMNHPIYYPLQDMDDRRSLISLLIYGIKNEGLTAYGDDEFKTVMTFEEVQRAYDAQARTQQVENAEGELVEEEIEGEFKYEEVTQYEIKEMWYFDRQHSTMRVRILGICPIRTYVDQETGQFRKAKTFWIYFPEVRPLLARQEVFNRNNDAQRISFDDLFWQRRFESYITQESNVYDNRPITTYMQGVNNLMEANRIQQEIFNIEHDLWEY
jgi:gliding motility associated protien GldN